MPMYSAVKFTYGKNESKYLSLSEASIICINDGNCEVTYRNCAENLNKGMYVFIKKNRRIRIKVLDCECQLALISLIHPPKIGLVSKSFNESKKKIYKPFFILDNNIKFSSTVNALNCINNLSSGSDGQVFILNAFYDFLSELGLLHFMFDHEPMESIKNGFDDIVYDYLVNIKPEQQTIKNVSDLFGLSRSTIIRRLRKSNSTFKQLVRESRMDMARELLETKTINTEYVSMLVGYQSTKLFNEYFFERYGIETSRLRLEIKEEK
ncbi:AraC family transcriptional regulator [Vibrio cholerae]|nr:AraC family transcriptional regulator [Vibrio cholerae]